jgi:xylulokinase
MIIAHDLGTSGDKASLHTMDGEIVATCTTTYGTHHAAGGIAEQDPGDWWRAVGESTRQLVSRAPGGPRSVRALVMSGQMMGAVFLDKRNSPVRRRSTLLTSGALGKRRVSSARCPSARRTD